MSLCIAAGCLLVAAAFQNIYVKSHKNEFKGFQRTIRKVGHSCGNSFFADCFVILHTLCDSCLAMTFPFSSFSLTQTREIDCSELSLGEVMLIPSPIEFLNENPIESVLAVPP
jgi:hypothetical protein